MPSALWHAFFIIEPGRPKFFTMEFITVVGLTASIGTGTSMLPQLFKIIKDKNADAVSPWMLTVLLTGLGAWVYYGAIKNDLIIIISNAFSFAVNIVIGVLKLKYKRQHLKRNI